MRFAIFSLALLLCGCIGPKVDTCLVDMNILETNIRASAITMTPDQIIAMIHNSEFEYCVPADDNKPAFYRKMESGQYVFSSTDFNTLLHWIEDHKN